MRPLLPLLVILPLSIQISFQIEPEFTLYWVFDYSSYAQGDQGEITISISNDGEIPFYVIWIGVHFQWESEGYFFQIDYSNSPVHVDVGEERSLGEIRFEVPDTAVPGENSYYLEVDYAWYSNGEIVKDTWDTEIYYLTVTEPFTVTWEILDKTTTFPAGGLVHYIMNVKNNMNTRVKIVSYGVGAGWLPKNTYEFVDDGRVVLPGSEFTLGPAEFTVSKTATEGWYNCTAIIEYQFWKNGEWSEPRTFKPDVQYAIEIVKEESLISKYHKIIGVIGGTLSMILTIMALKEKLAGKK